MVRNIKRIKYGHTINNNSQITNYFQPLNNITNRPSLPSAKLNTSQLQVKKEEVIIISDDEVISQTTSTIEIQNSTSINIKNEYSTDITDSPTCLDTNSQQTIKVENTTEFIVETNNNVTSSELESTQFSNNIGQPVNDVETKQVISDESECNPSIENQNSQPINDPKSTTMTTSNDFENVWWMEEWGHVQCQNTSNQQSEQMTIYSSIISTSALDLPPFKGPLPQCRKVPGTSFSVDAFKYGCIPGCKAYFLTHFHSDHYTGLTSKFKYGTIYCSPITYNLVLQQLRVKPEYVVKLPMNQTVIVDNVKVTLYGANHCPGSNLFLFEVPNPISSMNKPTRILHTGDFRVSSEHCSHPHFQNLNHVYLDTTYLNPTYKFPPQIKVLQETVKLVKQWMGDKSLLNESKQSTLLQFFKKMTPLPSATQSSHKKKLILVGTYTIGKERIFLAIAEALNSKIYVSKDKQKILNCFENDNIQRLITRNPKEANVHVVPMNQLNRIKLQEYLDQYKGIFDQVLALKPTGWTFSNDNTNKFQRTVAYSNTQKSDSEDGIKFQKLTQSSKVSLYGVPYSEHSSFEELQQFIESISNKQLNITPTVKPMGVSYSQVYDYLKTWKSIPN